MDFGPYENGPGLCEGKIKDNVGKFPNVEKVKGEREQNVESRTVFVRKQTLMLRTFFVAKTSKARKIGLL